MSLGLVPRKIFNTPSFSCWKALARTGIDVDVDTGEGRARDWPKSDMGLTRVWPGLTMFLFLHGPNWVWPGINQGTVFHGSEQGLSRFWP